MKNIPNYPDLTGSVKASAEPESTVKIIRSKEYDGSMQQALLDHLGNYVQIEFLIGTNNTVIKEGILDDVGLNFVSLLDEQTGRSTICDLYSIKFMTCKKKS